MKKIKKIIPDTSIIIEGIISEQLSSNTISVGEIVIHEAVMAELEAQANQNREIGYFGIEEIKTLREIAKKKKIKISYKGERPTEFEITRAKQGEIDALIRCLALTEEGTLITGDKVQALVAEAKGISVKLVEFETKLKNIKIEEYFDKKTMSVHLREGVRPYAKKGEPGAWEFKNLSKSKITHNEVKDVAKEILEQANLRKDGFIEISRKGSTIIQLGRYRIVITKPPFSDGWEITAVRPVKTLKLEDYELSDKLQQRIAKGEGILIAGSPGMGKTTFAQALAEYYASQNKVVKTVEAPRDLAVSDFITQYSIALGSSQEIHDILLLTRPDHTIFDEVRNYEDFKLFSDLRLAGVGMVGVLHATKPIDAIQRFLGKVEMGIIPQVVDTVIFIKNGNVNKILSMKMVVKVPEGMTEADLARPVVVVTDFESGKTEYEIYTYGEQTVVIPTKGEEKTGVHKLAKEHLKQKLSNEIDNFKVEILSDNRCVMYVPEGDISKIIGKQGKNIEKLEKKVGIGIDVQPMKKETKEKGVPFDAAVTKRNVTIQFDLGYVNKNVDIFVEDEYILSAKVSKSSRLKIKKSSEQGKTLINALKKGFEIKVFA